MAGTSSAEIRAPAFLRAVDEPAHGEDALLEPGEPAAAFGARLGRYFLLERLGHGGTGVVYKAYDPKLDRQVALKLLRIKARSQEQLERAQERLLREAQALARLTHPNVVSVYDVGTVDEGLHRDSVYLTLEYIEGQTLNEWLLSAKPDLRRILEVMIAAGRGIAAAHAAGLIHRDIKPSNIIIGADGRPRVLDFGLARSVPLPLLDGDAPRPSDPADERLLEVPLPTGKKLSSQITPESRVVGTPGYMAPEQYLGGDLNPHSDQFSFCVTLYKALYGRRPFTAKTYRSLLYRVTIGRVDPPPPESGVPAWLRRIVLKGLSVKETDRYPSMDALLASLSRDPRMVLRRALAIGLGVLAVLGLLAVGALTSGRTARFCEQAGAPLRPVWGKEAQRAVHASFLATARSNAQDTFDRTRAILDARAQEWEAMQREACATSRVKDDRADASLARQAHCLERRLGEMRALVELLARRADPRVVDQAIQAAYSLSDRTGCADGAALQAAVPEPAESALRARVEALERRLDAARALQATGQLRAGLAEATAVLQEARAIRHAPVQARAAFQAGALQAEIGQMRAAEDHLKAALRLSAIARDDALRARVTTRLTRVVGAQPERMTEGEVIGAFALTEVVRAGSPPLLLADALFERSRLAAHRGRLTEALRLGQRTLALREKVLGPEHPAVAETLAALGAIAQAGGQLTTARRLILRAQVLLQASLGPDHPRVARALYDLSRALSALSLGEQAKRVLERALVIDARQAGLPVAFAQVRFAIARALWSAEREAF